MLNTMNLLLIQEQEVSSCHHQRQVPSYRAHTIQPNQQQLMINNNKNNNGLH